jgi:hypothetical protein
MGDLYCAGSRLVGAGDAFGSKNRAKRLPLPDGVIGSREVEAAESSRTFVFACGNKKEALMAFSSAAMASRPCLSDPVRTEKRPGGGCRGRFSGDPESKAETYLVTFSGRPAVLRKYLVPCLLVISPACLS